MPRTRKSLFRQNLNRVPVLIEDSSQESVYFNIKQLNSYFTGGRNAFLITGTALLELNTEIFIEILDADGNPIYVEAIRNFSEARSRVIVVEIYENTPRGAATLTILGTAARLANGSPVPNEWVRRRNVRWQKKLIIEPRHENITSIRLKRQPQLLVTELQATASLLSQSFIDAAPNFQLTPKNVINNQRGYVIENKSVTPFTSYQKLPKITGSLFLETRTYKIAIPPTTSSYTVIASETSSVELPLRLLNSKTAFTDVNITSSVTGKILNVTPLLSGTYELTSSAFSSSATEYVQTVSLITSSIKYNYISESIFQTSESLSLAKLRIVNLDTVSGQIYRVKTSNKSAASNLEFISVADTPTLVGEILVTGSQVVNEREIPIGIFNTDDILQSNWYAYLTTGSTLPDPAYTSSSISSSFHLPLLRDDNRILDGGYAVTTSSSYFFGTKNTFDVFQNSEYTLTFDSNVYTTSGSFVASGDYILDVYIVGDAIPTTNPFGEKIGSLGTREKTAYFPNTQFNFTVPRNGSIGIRFVVNGGFWQFGNVSLKVAEEYAFNPDEVTFLLLNENKFDELVEYKTDFYDIDNNALSLSAISIPTFLTGSRKYVLRSGDNMWGRLVIEGGGIEVTGSSAITGSLSIISGSTLNIVSGSEFIRWGNTQFNYGAWYDAKTQSASLANTPYSMSLSSESFSRGFEIVSESRITAKNDGLYNFQFSTQLENTANNNAVVDIWFAKNQQDVSHSNTKFEVLKSSATAGKAVAALNFMEYLESGSYLELRWLSNQTSMTLKYEPSGANFPEIPSIIATIHQVA
jgi:hypothetical protein